MADKTCGMCAIGDNTTVWCGELGRRMPSWHEACGEYEDRSDSVEQVALDMMGYLGFCAEQFIVPFGGKIDEFSNRMDELGVKR